MSLFYILLQDKWEVYHIDTVFLLHRKYESLILLFNYLIIFIIQVLMFARILEVPSLETTF